MTAQPGADELRIRGILKQRGVGPDATPPDPTPPEPAVRERDWLDDILDTPAAPEPPTKPETPPATDAETKPGPAKKRRPKTKPRKPSRKPAHRGAPQHAPDPFQMRSPRQSLLDAWDNVRPRTRWLIYHATAAGFGWGLGIVGWSTHVTAWIAADRWADPQSITCYALALGVVALYRRTRHWWWPVAWMTAIPVSSIVTGVLLYAPNA